jgi:outer membrane protein OmpA-like peptidoglycan-associated protein
VSHLPAQLNFREAGFGTAWKSPLAVLLVLVLSVAGCASVLEEAAPVADATQPWSDGEIIARLKENGLQAEPSQRGIVVLLPSVFFAFDDTSLTPEARVKIRATAMVLSERQSAAREISVEGHTDSVGPAGYNLDLSRRRAEAVARELVLNGIRRERISTIGFGETRPLVPQDKPQGRTSSHGDVSNRRVELIIRRRAGVSTFPNREVTRCCTRRLEEETANEGKASGKSSAV